MLTARSEDHDDACPICRGDLPGEIVEVIVASASSQGIPMSGDEFREWLDDLDHAEPPS